ncbi:Hypothetical Protein OBI_RACECAR_67 [Arthrobacter phage Racecar]|nr:hypothetical protein PBI_RACECAR_149 [Arthrobacter phage Racecar]QFG12823.1 hypothetical protein PBI_MIMI_146 [Arthrobacter phage Mimi]
MEFLIILLPLVMLSFPFYHIVLPELKTRYSGHMEMRRNLLQIRSVGKEWRELKEHQEMLAEDPIALEHYERKRQERLKAHKEYDKLLWDAQAPEREAKLKALSEKIEKERLERIAIYEKETQLQIAENLDTLRQKELNYYNVSQSYGGNMLNPTQRLADVSTVLREEPSTNSRSLVPIPSNTIINATGWVHGQRYGGTDIWFAVKMGTYPDGKDYYQYVWAGACTEQHTGGLHNFNEYEEDTYTLRSFDGTADRTYINRTLIKKEYPPAVEEGKSKHFYQNSCPSHAESNVGDLWFDTSNGHKIYQKAPSHVWKPYTHPSLPSSKEIETYKDIQKAKFYLDAGANTNTLNATLITASHISVPKEEPIKLVAPNSTV